MLRIFALQSATELWLPETLPLPAWQSRWVLPASVSKPCSPSLAELAFQTQLDGSYPLCAALQVIIKHGLPRFRPFPAALKQWVMPASASTDFQYLLLSVLFLQARPMALASLPRVLCCPIICILPVTSSYCLQSPRCIVMHDLIEERLTHQLETHRAWAWGAGIIRC